MSEKQKQAWSVFFAVFCGGFCGWMLGQYLAKQLPSGWGGLIAWVACVVTGGLLGYLLVDPWGFIAKIPNAVRTAWRECLASASLWPRCAHIWKYKGTWLLALMSNGAWFACVYAVKKDPFWLPEDRLLATLLHAAWLFHGILCAVFLPLLNEKKRFPNDEDMTAARHIVVYYGNPVCCILWVVPLLIFVVVRGMLRYAITLLTQKVPFFVRFVCRFFWHLYCLTHTKPRLIAMTYATLSAGVAFFSHSITLGVLILLIGAVWGVVNYLFIAPYLVPRIEPLLVKEG